MLWVSLWVAMAGGDAHDVEVDVPWPIQLSPADNRSNTLGVAGDPDLDGLLTRRERMVG